MLILQIYKSCNIKKSMCDMRIYRLGSMRTNIQTKNMLILTWSLTAQWWLPLGKSSIFRKGEKLNGYFPINHSVHYKVTYSKKSMVELVVNGIIQLKELMPTTQLIFAFGTLIPFFLILFKAVSYLVVFWNENKL